MTTGRPSLRTIEFVRHIPLRRLAHRAAAKLKRLSADRRWTRRSVVRARGLTVRCRPPHPIFGPRSGRLGFEGCIPLLTFLGVTRPFTRVLLSATTADMPGEQLWLMNLHYMEYLEEADDEAFARLVREWLDTAHPVPRGAWADRWNSYATSLRIVVWCQQLAARPQLDITLRRAMLDSLAEQIAFLSRNLELDIGGNHLVKNAKALIWASAFLVGPITERWRRIGVRLLADILKSQVLEDGVHEELSPSYHAQVFADLLECRLALGPGCLDREFETALPAMAQVVADLAHPDGGCALFNDAGMSMAYLPGECLLAYEKVTRRPAPQPRPAFAFRKAGYFGWRRGEDCLIADCGPIGPDHLPAHAHADVLSFELSVSGLRVFVDQGVFQYAASDRRAASRSAAMHNTLCFEGSDQADFFGDFRVGRRPKVVVMAYETNQDRLTLAGTHNGFDHLPGRPGHIRTFEASPGRLEITDRVRGRPKGYAIVRYLVHPDWEIEPNGACAFHLKNGDITMTMVANHPLEKAPAVWWPDMGVEIATNSIRARIASGAAGLTTTITWSRPGG